MRTPNTAPSAPRRTPNTPAPRNHNLPPVVDTTIPKVVIVGLGHDAMQQSIDAAHEQHQAYLHAPVSRVRRMGRAIRSTMTGEVSKHRAARGLNQQIQTSGNVFQHQGMTADEWTQTSDATLERFENSLIDVEAGESMFTLNKTTEGQALQATVHDLIERFVHGDPRNPENNLNEDNFDEAMNRALADLARGKHTKKEMQHLVGEGQVFASNLKEVAIQTKAYVEHKRNIDNVHVTAKQVLTGHDIVVGEGRIGARTEATHNPVERLAKKLDRFGINEATAFTVASIGYTFGQWTARSTVGAAGKVAGLALGAGVWAGFRARGQAKQERRLISRQHEMSFGNNRGDRLSQDIQNTVHETVRADLLIRELEACFDRDGNLIDTMGNFDTAATLLTEIEGRRILSGRNKIGLIQFNGKEAGRERLELMRLTAQTSVQLEALFNALPANERQMMVASGRFDDFRQDGIDSVIGAANGSDPNTLMASVKARDRLARKLNNKEFVKGFAKGAFFGTIGGLVAQEATAALLGGHYGLVDAMLHHDVTAGHNTLLENVREDIFGRRGNAIHHIRLENSARLPENSGGIVDINLPDGYSAERVGDVLTIKGSDGSTLDGLHLGPDGKFTPDSMAKLNGAGFNIGSSYDTVPVTETHAVTPQEYLAHHLDKTHQVVRAWDDNDTPAPKFDLNEQGLRVNVEPNGDVVYTLKMTETGSFHGGRVDDYLEAGRAGNLEMKMSLTENTQANPIGVKFEMVTGPDGQQMLKSVIPHDTALAQQYDPDGTFHGAYAEVGVVDASAGQNAPQNFTVLATQVGQNNINTMTDTVTVNKPHVTFDFSKKPVVDVPPVIPIFGRRGIRSNLPDERQNRRTQAPREEGQIRPTLEDEMMFQTATPTEREQIRENFFNLQPTRPPFNDPDNPDPSLRLLGAMIEDQYNSKYRQLNFDEIARVITQNTLSDNEDVNYAALDMINDIQRLLNNSPMLEFDELSSYQGRILSDLRTTNYNTRAALEELMNRGL